MGRKSSVLLLAVFTAGALRAADADLKQILDRLDRVEAENARLREEVQALKEKLGVQEVRTEEQQQVKVESAEKAPVKLTGMLLMNVFSSGRNGAPPDFPTVATANAHENFLRGTFAQTSIGIEVESPTEIAGAHARGQVMADFYGEYERYSVPRIRTAFLDLQWNSRAIRLGIEKPIVAPRNPVSLANVVYPALWGAGNLWFWQPQVRLEQALKFGATEVRAQAGLFQTLETVVGWSARFTPAALPVRPSWQGRVQFARRFEEDRAIEFAPGFAYSRTLVAGGSVPSQLVTADWLIRPAAWAEFSGAMFHGKNAMPLGGLRQGVVLLPNGTARAVGTTGGWAQLMVKPMQRLRFHAMAGQQDDRRRDLLPGGIDRNLSYAVNGILQLSPNVLLGLEAQQIRTTFVGSSTRLLNRYDLALAYMF